MIAFQDVHKRFGTREVLRGVTAEFAAGRITALIGPNGSGKTTLIKMILGLAKVDSGSVEVDGEPIETLASYRTGLGYMPQIARFPEQLRVRDLLSTIGALRPGMRIDTNLINDFHLAAEMDKRLGTLSGGTRQKVNAVIAFAFNPTILVLDEPTAGLDPVASRLLKQRIRRARADGCTVLITSHVLSELEELADNVAFLHDGVIRFSGSARELLNRTGQDGLEDAIAALMDPIFAARGKPAEDQAPRLTLIRSGGEQ